MLLLAAIASTVVGCVGDLRLILPDGPAVAHHGPSQGLLAGFGRSDITPPLGIALAGHGSEGVQATGYRQRLHIRTMVLQDTSGRRVAIGVADLSYITLPLHRMTAERLAARNLGIGAAQLILSATHTHSGPGNFFGNKAMNGLASSLPGYDSVLVDFLTERFADAFEQAAGDLAPAVAAWDTAHVTGLTRNRSFEAYSANVPKPTARDVYSAVDSVWAMLRVDRCDQDWEHCVPRGAFSVFAMHATGNNSINDLYDADIPGVVARGLEAHLAALTNGGAAFHLFANGAEGDVSPNHQPPSDPTLIETPYHETRCPGGVHFDAARNPAGPTLSGGTERWFVSSSDRERCLESAAASVSHLGNALTLKGIALHAKIGAALQEPRKKAEQFAIDVAFETIDLPGYTEGAHGPLCELPSPGAPLLGGAEDGRTRLYRLRPLWFLDLNARERTFKENSSCQSPKKDALGGLVIQMFGADGGPMQAQLAVVRLGDGLVGAVPAEVSTMAGERMEASIRAAAPADVEGPAVLLGLANGNVHYLTTAEEYALQHYEGGSTLYGPKTEEVFSAILGRLTASIASGSPVLSAPSLPLNLGPAISYFTKPDRGGRPRTLDRSLEVACTADGLIADWTDVRPGAMRIADSRVVEIYRSGPPQALIAWDDMPSVTVRAKSSRPGRRYGWEVRWSPEAPLQTRQEYSVVLPKRDTYWGVAPRAEASCIVP